MTCASERLVWAEPAKVPPMRSSGGKQAEGFQTFSAIAVTPLSDAQIHAYEADTKPQQLQHTFSCACVYGFGVLSAAAAAKTQDICGFPDAVPGRVCPVTANSGRLHDG